MTRANLVSICVVEQRHAAPRRATPPFAYARPRSALVEDDVPDDDARLGLDVRRGRQNLRDRAVAKILPPTADVEPESRIVVWDIVLDKG